MRENNSTAAQQNKQVPIIGQLQVVHILCLGDRYMGKIIMKNPRNYRV